MNHQLALIFPPFVNEYLGIEKEIINDFNYNIKALFEKAEKCTSFDFSQFDEKSNHFLENELVSQYIAYIFSCAVSDILTERNVVPFCISGYSMGLYAALYHAKVITFETGIELIGKAHQLIFSTANDTEYSMATIVGFTENDIIELIGDKKDSIEIINRNNQHTFVLSGFRPIINAFVEKANQEGALFCKLLNVSAPYHSKFMYEAGMGFGEYLKSIEIVSSKVKLISLLTQKVFSQPAEIRFELTENIYKRMNWQATVEKMHAMGVKHFIECGAGESLTKMNKFIEGEFNTIHLGKLTKYLKTYNLSI